MRKAISFVFTGFGSGLMCAPIPENTIPDC